MAQQIHREAAQSAHVFRRVTDANATVVFAEDDIEYSMTSILNAPMSTHGVCKAGGIYRQTAQVVTPLNGRLGLDFAGRFHGAHAL